MFCQNWQHVLRWQKYHVALIWLQHKVGVNDKIIETDELIVCVLVFMKLITLFVFPLYLQAVFLFWSVNSVEVYKGLQFKSSEDDRFYFPLFIFQEQYKNQEISKKYFIFLWTMFACCYHCKSTTWNILCPGDLSGRGMGKRNSSIEPNKGLGTSCIHKRKKGFHWHLDSGRLTSEPTAH